MDSRTSPLSRRARSLSPLKKSIGRRSSNPSTSGSSNSSSAGSSFKDVRNRAPSTSSLCLKGSSLPSGAESDGCRGVGEALAGPEALKSLPRWPVECPVVYSRVKHIRSSPSEPELFYDCNGKEPMPRPMAEEMGSLVYEYKGLNSLNYFSKSISSPPNASPPIISPINEPGGLIFESRFESGNLASASRITEAYYELSLRPDLYTSRHTQWFYFQVRNMRPDLTYRFSITNFSKPDALYVCGMKPVLYSCIEAERHYVGWTRVGSNIRYYKNEPGGKNPEESDHQDESGGFSLSFNIRFPHEGDVVYLAHCIPYTYSDLQEDLRSLTSSSPDLLELRVLCKSLAGNNVYLLSSPTGCCEGEGSPSRKVIFLSARVHPGESPSSWILRGLLFFLFGSSEEARILRERYVFKIVPMLNPDGVIVGNTRTSLTGRDLNRQYKAVLKEAFPPIYHTKALLKRYIEEGRALLYCDFHAHSRKFNAFIYGCENRRHSERYLREQIFPLMLHKNSSERFSFEDCKFRVSKNKETTGRVVFWSMGLLASYTLEASYGGSNLGSRAFTHFNTRDYESLGRSFCESLLDFLDPCPLRESIRSKIHSRLLKEGSSSLEPVNIILSEYSSLSRSSSSCSSSPLREKDGPRCAKTRRRRRRMNGKPEKKYYGRKKKGKERPEFYIGSNASDPLKDEDINATPPKGSGDDDSGNVSPDVVVSISNPLLSQKKLHLSASNCRRVQSEILASVHEIKCSWMRNSGPCHNFGIYLSGRESASFGCMESTTEDEQVDEPKAAPLSRAPPPPPRRRLKKSASLHSRLYLGKTKKGSPPLKVPEAVHH